MLCDTSELPVPLEQMRRCLKMGKMEEKDSFDLPLINFGGGLFLERVAGVRGRYEGSGR